MFNFGLVVFSAIRLTYAVNTIPKAKKTSLVITGKGCLTIVN